MLSGASLWAAGATGDGPLFLVKASLDRPGQPRAEQTVGCFELSVCGGRRHPQAVYFIRSQPWGMRAPALKGHDGLAALNVDCTRPEVPLVWLAFQHIPCGRVGSGAQGGEADWPRTAWPQPCHWETLCLA